MFKIIPLKIDELSFLSESNTLFICDFRATGESFDYDIPAMWKYENLLTNIVRSGIVLCNDDIQKLNTKNHQQERIILNKGSDSRDSLIKRFIEDSKNKLSNNIEKIWTAVPHPDIDNYARNKNIPVQYKYDEFLNFNYKFLQKELCNSDTPEWNKIENLDEYKKFFQKNNINSKDYFLKRSIGSGGYCIWKPNVNLNLDFNYKYFIEKRVEGISSSVQIYIEEDNVIIFGYSHQLIKNDKEFYGANLLSLDKIPEYCIEAIKKIIISFKNNLFKNYQGFLGIDFVDDKEIKKCWFLESNIRVTALTIPTLLKNTYFINENILFMEDAEEASEDDFIIGIDSHYHTYDILRKIK